MKLFKLADPSIVNGRKYGKDIFHFPGLFKELSLMLSPERLRNKKSPPDPEGFLLMAIKYYKAICFSTIILRMLIRPYRIRPNAVLMLHLVRSAISLKLKSA